MKRNTSFINYKQWIQYNHALIKNRKSKYNNQVRQTRPMLTCNRSFTEIDLNNIGNYYHLDKDKIIKLKQYNQIIEKQSQELISAIDDEITCGNDIISSREDRDEKAIHKYSYKFRNTTRVAPSVSKALIKLTEISLKHREQGINSVRYSNLIKISKIKLDSAKYYDIHNLLVQKIKQLKNDTEQHDNNKNSLVYDKANKPGKFNYSADKDILNGFHDLEYNHDASKAVIKILNGLHVLANVNINKTLNNFGINTSKRPGYKKQIYRKIISKHSDMEWFRLLKNASNINLHALQQICNQFDRLNRSTPNRKSSDSSKKIDTKPVNFKKLHLILRMITTKPNYKKLYNLVHKYGDNFAINFFDSLVDRLASNGAVIVSVNFAMAKINDSASVKKDKFVFKRIERIARESAKTHSKWCIYDHQAKLSNQDTSRIAKALDHLLVAPAIGKSGYNGENAKQAANCFKKDLQDLKRFYQISYKISISNKLNNNMDPIGIRLFCKYLRKIDILNLNNLKKHDFNYVIKIKQVTKDNK